MSLTRPDDHLIQSVLQDYAVTCPRWVQLTTGHIHTTYKVDSRQGPFVLQRVSPIFPAEMHHDIQAVVQHLKASGLKAPSLVPTLTGRLWTQDAQGHLWRLQTFVEGQVYTRVTHPDLCKAAGFFLGRFHRALTTFNHRFHASVRPPHDPTYHLNALHHALQTHPHHPAYAQVAPLAEELEKTMRPLLALEVFHTRMGHRDPKLSNFIFSSSNHVVCMVDLDAVGYVAFPWELADAFRSWCHACPTHPHQPQFNVAWLDLSLRAYHQGSDGLMQAEEWVGVPAALHLIILELTARFARDSLEETYFNWDPQRYPTAWQNQLHRSHITWRYACAYAQKRLEVEQVVRKAVASFRV